MRYASVVEEPDTSACTVKEVTLRRQHSFRRKGSKDVRQKPPLPPSQVREAKHRDIYTRTSKKVGIAEDGTSISDDLETDPHSVLHTMCGDQKRSHLRPASNFSSQAFQVSPRDAKIGGARFKDTNQHHREALDKIKHGSKRLSVSEMSDSGIFRSVTEAKDATGEWRYSDDAMLLGNGVELEDMSEQLRRVLQLYQTKLIEKDKLLEMYEVEVIDLETKLQAVQKENQDLRKLLPELQMQTIIPIDEWRLLREQAQLVLEENEALTGQLDHLQTKMRENHIAHVNQATLLKQMLNARHDEKQMVQEELRQLQDRFEILRDEYNLVRLRSQDQMSREEHSESVRECKRLLDDLKAKYQLDIDRASAHLKVLQKEKVNLTLNVSKLSGENQQLDVENKVLLQVHRKLLLKLRQLKKVHTKCKAENLGFKFKLKMLQNQVLVLEEDRNKYSKIAMQLSDEINSLLSQIEDSALSKENIQQLRLAKMRLMEKLHDESTRLSATNRAFHEQKLDYERRLRRLHRNIARKTQRLEKHGHR